MIFMSWGAHPPQMCTLHRHWNRKTWCKNVPNLHRIFTKSSPNDNTVPWCTMHYRHSSSLAWAVADFCNYGRTSHTDVVVSTMAVYKNPGLWEIIFLCLSSAIWAPCHNQSPSPSTRKAPLPRTKKLVGLHEEAASDFQLKIHCNRMHPYVTDLQLARTSHQWPTGFDFCWVSGWQENDFKTSCRNAILSRHILGLQLLVLVFWERPVRLITLPPI